MYEGALVKEETYLMWLVRICLFCGIGPPLLFNVKQTGFIFSRKGKRSRRVKRDFDAPCASVSSELAISTSGTGPIAFFGSQPLDPTSSKDQLLLTLPLSTPAWKTKSGSIKSSHRANSVSYIPSRTRSRPQGPFVSSTVRSRHPRGVVCHCKTR